MKQDGRRNIVVVPKYGLLLRRKLRLETVGTGVQNSNCIKLLLYKLYNIEHWTYIYLIALHVYMCLNISYDIHVRSLSYIVFDQGLSNEIITQKIIVISPCNF
jgi:hypothetical protein